MSWPRINYHIGPDSKSPAKAVLSAVTSVKADGPDTVIFELVGRQRRLPLSCFPTITCRSIPPKDGKIEWEKGIGAGPYILKSFEPGVKLVGKRNPNYFKDTWFDGVEMLSIVDTAARTNAYLAGEVHFIDRADLKTIDMLKSCPNTELYNETGFGHYTAPMHATRRPSTIPMCARPSNMPSTARNSWTRCCLAMARRATTIRSRPTMKFAIDPQPSHLRSGKGQEPAQEGRHGKPQG